MLIAEIYHYSSYSFDSCQRIVWKDLQIWTRCENKGNDASGSQRGLSRQGSCSGSQRPTRSKSWACEWLKRYDKEGIEGLKTRQKSGRPSDIRS